jgi:hypothetical protein
MSMTKLKAMTAQDCELLTTNAGYLRQHARVLMEMPAGEQFIGGRDAVLYSALIQIAECLERLAK